MQAWQHSAEEQVYAWPSNNATLQNKKKCAKSCVLYVIIFSVSSVKT
jgi:hypothetical protein